MNAKFNMANPLSKISMAMENVLTASCVMAKKYPYVLCESMC